MKCIPYDQDIKIPKLIHEGICGAHASYHSLIRKAYRQGLYQSDTFQDAQELFKMCKACQFQSCKIYQPTQALDTIPLSWTFLTWGLDLLGPFNKTPDALMFMIIAIDKLTKWIKVKPLKSITVVMVEKFIQQNIMTHHPKKNHHQNQQPIKEPKVSILLHKVGQQDVLHISCPPTEK